ncbi:MAG: hypothetical protein CM1200mP6_04380 [Anaerolineaceae bacterium]|nr:MAG: hypothetical protein CM1200mP6_04380 [Anaerolineaceae bacterium]
MYGTGILKGMGVTIRHLVDSFVDDMRFLGQRYYSDSSMKIRQGTEGRGVFTVQYPEKNFLYQSNFGLYLFCCMKTMRMEVLLIGVHLGYMRKSMSASMYLDREVI